MSDDLNKRKLRLRYAVELRDKVGTQSSNINDLSFCLRETLNIIIEMLGGDE